MTVNPDGAGLVKSRRWTRRSALQLAAVAAGSPLLAQNQGAQPPRPQRIYPPSYSDEVMAAVNVHEMEDIARQKIPPMAYDYIAGGSAGELTLQANREAFTHVQIRRRVGVDVSKIDTSLELLGKKLDFPILLGPGGHQNLVYADGQRLAVQAAAHSKAICMPGPAEWLAKMQGSQDAPMWWAASLGFSEQAAAQAFAKRAEGA